MKKSTLQAHKLVVATAFFLCSTASGLALQPQKPWVRKGTGSASFDRQQFKNAGGFENDLVSFRQEAPLDQNQKLYNQFLAEQAQSHVLASETARKELLPLHLVEEEEEDERSVRKTCSGKAILGTTDAGTLVIDLPSPGFGAKDIFSGAFSIAWFSVVVPATFSGAGVFMLPFWIAGGAVAKSAVVDPFKDTRLEIGEFAWSLTSKIRGKILTLREGETNELLGAQLDMTTMQTKKNGPEKPLYRIKLLGTRKENHFSVASATVEELQSLCNEINKHLATFRGVKRKSSPRDIEVPNTPMNYEI